MKLVEITLTEEQLMELKIRHALAAAGLAGAAALSGFGNNDSVQPPPSQLSVGKITRAATPPPAPVAQTSDNLEIQDLTQIILDKYRIDPQIARSVAVAAKKHEQAIFPKAEDILSIIGIESSFDPASVSKLSRDPAIGLTQVRLKVHGLTPHDVSTIDKQVLAGVKVLSRYYNRFKSPTAAIQAYNVGETKYSKLKRRKLDHNTAEQVKAAGARYLNKFKEEKKNYM